uniref:Uncharacterized protein n=1 Tax=Panagrellus redivivus TaxID=6233 RepID=A0A7E5A157_PANRE
MNSKGFKVSSALITLLLFVTLYDDVGAVKCYVSGPYSYHNARGLRELVAARALRTIEDGCQYCSYVRKHDAGRLTVEERFYCVTDRELKVEEATRTCLPLEYYGPRMQAMPGFKDDIARCQTDLCNYACDEIVERMNRG